MFIDFDSLQVVRSFAAENLKSSINTSEVANTSELANVS
jgi:hypothetical protein